MSKKHIAAAGETWDMIALKYYYDEFKMNQLMQANRNYSNVIVFEGGEVLEIPELTDDDKPASLPPWRR